jgi:hypothetical protein
VVDALPETREARRFQKAHPGVVWLAQYVQQGLEPEWSYRDGLVKAPRTVILDETLQRFREGAYVLPPDIRAPLAAARPVVRRYPHYGTE